MKITVATMNRAIRKIELDLDVDYYQQGACEEQVLEAIRQGYLQGLEDAAKVATGPRKVEPISPFAEGYDVGHDAHVVAIRETAKRLRKEAGK